VSPVSQQKPGYVQIGQQDQILDALATAVILLDTDLRIVSLNPASETLPLLNVLEAYTSTAWPTSIRTGKTFLFKFKAKTLQP
jgi:hypothetical protein